MLRLAIERTAITPRVELCKEDGIFIIEGKSLPENAKDFFTPIIEWFDLYSTQPNQHTVLELNFEYFNTATSKMLLIILAIMRSIGVTGRGIEVIWRYPQHDEELEEAGHEFAELLGLNFRFVPAAD